MYSIYLKSIEVSGIKSLEEPVVIDFYNKTIQTHILDLKDSNIKAIYGPNGSGKSAIIQAMGIYKSLNYYDNYLYDNKNISYLSSLINNKNSTMKMKVEFLSYDPKTFQILKHFKHTVALKRNYLGIEIAEEKIEQFKVKHQENTSNEVIYHYKTNHLQTNISKYLLDKITNRVNKNTLINIYINLMMYDEEALLKLERDSFKFFDFYRLIPQLNIMTVEEDIQEHYTNFLLIKEKSNQLVNPINRHSKYTDSVYLNYISIYKNSVEKLTSFIKLFKPDLTNIELEIKQDNDILFIDKIFVYENSKVNLSLESTGIKKLVKLFTLFDMMIQNNAIIFIDELDSHINDVYLIKLLDYFSKYPKGQLIFTTHNVGPMEILKNRKNSIDFISSDGKITKYAKNGNYSVVKLYREGMINGLPFNLESFDFLSVFGNDDEWQYTINCLCWV